MEVDIEKIKELCLEYGYYDSIIERENNMPITFENNDKRVKHLLSFWPNNIGQRQIGEIKRENIVGMIDFLRRVSGGIKMEGSIDNPRKGQVKGAALKFSFDDDLLILALLDYLNTLLEKVQDGLYQYELGIDVKNEIMIPLDNGTFYKTGYTERYSDEELSKIMMFENTIKQQSLKLKGNARIGKRLKDIYDRMAKNGIWGNDSKQKRYCFLYDWLTIAGVVNELGKGFNGTLGKEKYTIVKNYIEAYNRKQNE